MERPILDKTLNSVVFLEYYYLKEELLVFCKENNLPTSGSKLELTNRIAYFLDTGEIKNSKPVKKSKNKIKEITLNTKIESDFVCSEYHRAFFKEQIGEQFSFNVQFQKWLKSNSGQTYEQAIIAYYQILEEKKNKQTVIDDQFVYNKYIRSFFAANKGYSLSDAITCWKYKKSLPGHNTYENEDLKAINGSNK